MLIVIERGIVKYSLHKKEGKYYPNQKKIYNKKASWKKENHQKYLTN